MIKKLCLAGMLAVLSIGAFAQQEDPALRRSVQAMYTQMDRYVSTGNSQGMLSLIDPSFVMVDRQGHQMYYPQLKASITAIVGPGSSAKTMLKLVQGKGEEATAWVQRVVNHRVRNGRGWTYMRKTSRYAETLKRTGAGWRVTYAQELPTDEPWSFGG